MASEGPGLEAPLTGLLDEFGGYYRPTLESRTAAYREGLVVLDTNALLDLYRYSKPARDEMIAVLRQISDRVFVPHRVALEFHRRRVQAVSDRAAELKEQQALLEKLRDQAKGHIRRVATRAHGRRTRHEEVLTGIDHAFDSAAEFLGGLVEDYDLDPDRLATDTDDTIVRELEGLLAGRVGPRPSDETYAGDLEEGHRRRDKKIPPGFADGGKKEADDAVGDYLWWAEVLRFAEATRPPSVLVVSNDVSKGDWVYESRGFRIGPAPSLVEEIRSSSDSDLLWATTSEFLEEAARLGGMAVSQETLDEARSSSLLPQVVGGIRLALSRSDRPVVGSALANDALLIDGTLKDTAWAGTGSFRSFLEQHLPDLEFINPPSPGYVVDPTHHRLEDLPGGNPKAEGPAGDRLPLEALLLHVQKSDDEDSYCVGTITYTDGSTAQTPIGSWPELEAKRAASRLTTHQVKFSPSALAWLKDQ